VTTERLVHIDNLVLHCGEEDLRAMRAGRLDVLERVVLAALQARRDVAPFLPAPSTTAGRTPAGEGSP
jgi:hypothetical protein